MNNYIVNQPITIYSGVLQLTAAQANTRLHNLKLLNSGLFEVIYPVNFKAGELFGHDGELPKNLASMVRQEPVKTKIEPSKVVEKPRVNSV